jgi:hypothetical protein
MSDARAEPQPGAASVWLDVLAFAVGLVMAYAVYFFPWRVLKRNR